MRKQCLEFALPNPGEICKHLAGAYNSNSHTRRLLLSYFVCKNKQKNQYNDANLLRKFVSEKLSIIDPL
jgi:ribosomal protein S18